MEQDLDAAEDELLGRFALGAGHMGLLGLGAVVDAAVDVVLGLAVVEFSRDDLGDGGAKGGTAVFERALGELGGVGVGRSIATVKLERAEGEDVVEADAVVGHLADKVQSFGVGKGDGRVVRTQLFQHALDVVRVVVSGLAAGVLRCRDSLFGRLVLFDLLRSYGFRGGGRLRLLRDTVPCGAGLLFLLALLLHGLQVLETVGVTGDLQVVAEIREDSVLKKIVKTAGIQRKHDEYLCVGAESVAAVETVLRDDGVGFARDSSLTEHLVLLHVGIGPDDETADGLLGLRLELELAADEILERREKVGADREDDDVAVLHGLVESIHEFVLASEVFKVEVAGIGLRELLQDEILGGLHVWRHIHAEAQKRKIHGKVPSFVKL